MSELERYTKESEAQIETIVNRLTAVPTNNERLQAFIKNSQCFMDEVINPLTEKKSNSIESYNYLNNINSNITKYRVQINKLIESFEKAKQESLLYIATLEALISEFQIYASEPDKSNLVAILQVNLMKKVNLESQIQAATALFNVLSEFKNVHLNVALEALKTSRINKDGWDVRCNLRLDYFKARSNYYMVLLISVFVFAISLIAITLSQGFIFASNQLLRYSLHGSSSSLHIGSIYMIFQFFVAIYMILLSLFLLNRLTIQPNANQRLKARYVLAITLGLLWLGLCANYGLLNLKASVLENGSILSLPEHLSTVGLFLGVTGLIASIVGVMWAKYLSKNVLKTKNLIDNL